MHIIHYYTLLLYAGVCIYTKKILFHMQSEYEKEVEQKKKRVEIPSKEKEVAVREIEAAMAAATASIDLMELNPATLAREITSAEVKAILDITPVEILRFSSSTSMKETAPTLYEYISFTGSLSSLVASSIIQSAPEKRYASVSASKSTLILAAPVSYWLSVMKELCNLHNANALFAIAQGIRRTRASRIDLEQVSLFQKEVSAYVSSENEERLQKEKIMYIRDAFAIEKHLIDASVNKKSKESSAKFHRIIQYLSHLRSYAEIEVNKDLNHALLLAIRKSREIRLDEEKCNTIMFKGCFLFMEHSSFISLNEK